MDINLNQNIYPSCIIIKAHVIYFNGLCLQLCIIIHALRNSQKIKTIQHVFRLYVSCNFSHIFVCRWRNQGTTLSSDNKTSEIIQRNESILLPQECLSHNFSISDDGEFDAVFDILKSEEYVDVTASQLR